MSKTTNLPEIGAECVPGRWMDACGAKDLVSVIIPTYGRARLLREAVESVRRQTYRPVEVLVIDDGSPKGTYDWLPTWEEQWETEPNFTFRFLQQPHRRPAAARNLGLIHSRGEYIQYLDSDDLLLPRKLEAQVQALRRDGGYDFVWSKTDSFQHPDPSERAPLCGGPECDPLEEFIAFGGWPWHVWSGLFTRGAVRRNGPWMEDLFFWDDWEYNVRFLCHDPRTRYVPGTFSLARMHSGGKMSDATTTPDGIKFRLKTADRILQDLRIAGKLTRRRRGEMSKTYYWIGRSATGLYMPGLARYAFKKAIDLPPPGIWGLRIRIGTWLLENIGLLGSNLLLRRVYLR